MRDVPGGAEHESEAVRMFYEEGVMGMTKDEVKRALREYRPTLSALEAAKSTLISAKATLDWIQTVGASGMSYGSGGVSDPVGNAVCRLQTAVDRVASAVNRYAAKLVQIEDLIALADDTQGQTIIRLRWQKDIEFDHIPAKINLERTAMFVHYERAISQISRKTESAD